MSLDTQARREGHKAMEVSLTPLARVLRKIRSGKPASRAYDTPLRTVLYATEQRERLSRILEEDEAIENPRVVRLYVDVVLRHPGHSGLLHELVEVVEGLESEAVARLESFEKLGHRFAISSISFEVLGHIAEHDQKTPPFPWVIERKESGVAALAWPRTKGAQDRA